MYQESDPYEYLNEQKELLNAVENAEKALVLLAYRIKNLKSEVKIDSGILESIAHLQPLLSKHEFSVLATTFPLSDNLNDYIHPFCCKESCTQHKEKVASCGAGK